MATIKQQLEQLSEKRETARNAAREIVAIGQEKDLTPEQEKEVDELIAAATEADEQIKALLDRDKQIQNRIDQIDGFEDHDTSNVGRGIHVPSRPTDAPRVPQTAMKWSPATMKGFHGVDSLGRSPQERAWRLGMWALAKISLDMPGKFRFPGAMRFAADQWGMGAPLAVHGEGGGDTSGSHVFVPDEFGLDLIKLRESHGVARQIFMMRPMTSDTRSDPRYVSGLTANFVGESAAGTESTGEYDQVNLTAKKLMVLTRMSSELNEDAAISMGDELVANIAWAFADKEDDCAFNGDGTSTYGGIRGTRNRLGTFTAGTDPGLIQGAGNLWSELTLANHESVLGALPQYADTPNAAWVCHRTYYYTVMVRLMLASGGVPAAEVRDGARTLMFLGYPVRIAQRMPSSEANSQIPVTFGDHAMAASFGDRRAETIAFSQDANVNSQSVFERDQIAVRGTERFDINVHDYGDTTNAGPIVALETQSS